ncbi:MAG TPA: DNA polymerase IV [Candidatus Omnitrophica bacterium]|nr:DNA polymerase IV [Candidatus Omnitrophota bacterium]
MLLHIDMDAFFASVEQQINPALRGKPVIVGSRDKKYHTVVAAASYEAKAYGIKSGMSSYEALKVCPHAEFVACDSAKYTYVSREIFNLLHDFSPFVEHSTIDEFDLEVDGLEPHFGSFLDLGKLIKKRIREAFGLGCSVGIAPTWILAKLGTKIRKPDGLILINDANLDALLQGLPVEKICGIGPALTAHLQGLGVFNCDQLKAIPQKILINNFGRSTGHWLYAVLRTYENLSYDKTILAPRTQNLEPKSIGHSYTLPRETNNRETIFAWLRMLSEMVAERARNSDFTGHTVSLWLSSKNDSLIRQRTYQLPTNDGWEIFARARAVFSQKKGHFWPIRALGVTLSGLIFNSTPPLLTEQKRREALLGAIDHINAKYGDWTLSPAILAQIKH